MLDDAAVALLRASTIFPRGSMRLARMLAAVRPSLRRYPARTKYGTLVCDVTEPSSFALATARTYKRWQPDEAAINAIPLDRHSSIVLDVGANIGVMTRIFAKRAKHVHAFEPSPKVLPFLRANAPDNCTIHPFALGDTEGRVQFTETESLDMSYVGEGPSTVEMRTLDSLGLNPDFIKIDVERGEPGVLRGARRTLERGPIVMFEALTPEALNECRSILQSANSAYRISDMGSGENFLAHAITTRPDEKPKTGCSVVVPPVVA